jgi:hypothetical protein
VLVHDAMINTLCGLCADSVGARACGLRESVRARYVAQDGLTVVTGDALGQLVTWDLRTSTLRLRAATAGPP